MACALSLSHTVNTATAFQILLFDPSTCLLQKKTVSCYLLLAKENCLVLFRSCTCHQYVRLSLIRYCEPFNSFQCLPRSPSEPVLIANSGYLRPRDQFPLSASMIITARIARRVCLCVLHSPSLGGRKHRTTPMIAKSKSGPANLSPISAKFTHVMLLAWVPKTSSL